MNLSMLTIYIYSVVATPVILIKEYLTGLMIHNIPFL